MENWCFFSRHNNTVVEVHDLTICVILHFYWLFSNIMCFRISSSRVKFCILFKKTKTFPLNFLRWSGSHIRWGQPFRLRHITTGKYLSLLDDKSLLLTDKEKADVKSTAFCFRSSKVWNQWSIIITGNNSNLFSLIKKRTEYN